MTTDPSNHNRHGLHGPHFRSNLPRIRLEIRRGRARNRMRPVTVPVFLIGTARDCDLVLGDPQFPEVHAYLFVSDRGVTLRHLGAGPVISIGQEEVRFAPLCDGDRIRTGPYEFLVHIGPDRGVAEDDHLDDPTARDRASSEQKQEAAVEKVERLLADIRDDLSLAQNRLCLHVEFPSRPAPEPPCRFAG